MTSSNGVSPAADLAAVRTADAQTPTLDHLRLANGIVLRLKPVPRHILREASARVLKPEVPIVHIEDRDRDEPNPNDPAYLEAMRKWIGDQSEAQFTIGLILGTEVDSVPDGMYGPDDDRWIAEMREAWSLLSVGEGDINVHEEKGSKARYLDWIRNYALVSETDQFLLTRVLVIGVAITEQEVSGMAESFRRAYAGISDLGSSAPAAPVDGGNDQAAVSGGGA